MLNPFVAAKNAVVYTGHTIANAAVYSANVVQYGAATTYAFGKDQVGKSYVYFKALPVQMNVVVASNPLAKGLYFGSALVLSYNVSVKIAEFTKEKIRVLQTEPDSEDQNKPSVHTVGKQLLGAAIVLVGVGSGLLASAMYIAYPLSKKAIAVASVAASVFYFVDGGKHIKNGANAVYNYLKPAATAKDIQAKIDANDKKILALDSKKDELEAANASLKNGLRATKQKEASEKNLSEMGHTI